MCLHPVPSPLPLLGAAAACNIPPFPALGGDATGSSTTLKQYKIFFLGLLRLHGQTVAFMMGSLVLLQLPLSLHMAHGECPAAVTSSDPGGWGSPVARKKLHRAKKWRSANPGLNPQPSMRQVCYFGRASVPGAGAGPSAEDCLDIGASLASGAPGELAPAGSSCGGGGLVGQQAGQQEAREHPEGPRPQQQRESSLRVINGFPGSQARDWARPGRQPAQHPRRLPQLSLPISFAPSSGDKPPWSLQGLRVRPRGLSHPPWVFCSPWSGCPCLPQLLPTYQHAGCTQSSAVQLSPPQRMGGSGLQHLSGRKTPSLPYSPGCQGNSREDSPLSTNRDSQPATCFCEEAEQQGLRPRRDPSLQSEPWGSAGCWSEPSAPSFQTYPRQREPEGSPHYSQSSTMGSIWLPEVCLGFSLGFFFFFPFFSLWHSCLFCQR